MLAAGHSENSIHLVRKSGANDRRYGSGPVIGRAGWYQTRIRVSATLEIKIALDGGKPPISRPFDKRLQPEAWPAIKAAPESVP